MYPVAEGIWQLTGSPRHMINAYLVGDVLIDAATRWARPRLLRQLRGRPLRLVALTHCHPDHQGAAGAVCRHFGVPLACHAEDVAAMEGRTPMTPHNRMVRLSARFWSGPPYPVGRILRDGDAVAGFRVIHAPGHTPGHVIYFREADRLALIGDVLANIHFLTGQIGLREPPPQSCVDPAQNRQSIRTLLDLRPALVCFGHGPPLRRPELLEAFAARLR